MKKTEVGDSVSLLEGVYTPGQTKAIIANFDMVISGRVHGAIAALSQCIPTVIIDYGHEPKAHKLRATHKLAFRPSRPFSTTTYFSKIGSKDCKHLVKITHIIFCNYNSANLNRFHTFSFPSYWL